MAEDLDRIAELEEENKSLKMELAKSQERERDLEEARRAMLLMMEDLNESSSRIIRIKNEWESTFDSISSPLFLHDAEFRIVRANSAYAEVAGVPFREIIGKPYFEVFPRMEGPFTTCSDVLFGREAGGEDTFTVSGRFYTSRSYVIKDPNGEYLYSIHIIEDNTEEKRAEDALRSEVDINANLLLIAESTAKTNDIDSLMTEVVRCGHKITGCDICLSYLWDRDARIYQPSHAFGLSHGMLPLFMTEPLDRKKHFFSTAMDCREPVVKQIGPDNELPVNWLKGASTAAIIPLTGKKGSLGLIIGIYYEDSDIGERDRKVMSAISHQVSTALEDARLYKDLLDKTMELSHKIETIQAMHEIDRSILSTLEPDEILEASIRMIAKVIPCDRATVALVDEDRSGLKITAGFGMDMIPKMTFISFEATNASDVIETGRPQYMANMSLMEELLPFEMKLKANGFMSHIRVPLQVKNEIVGILAIGAKRPSAFTPEDLSTLEKMASQIDVALENSRLMSDMEELFLGTVKSLSAAIDAKSPWTAGHSERVTKYALLIGKELGLSGNEMKSLELAGLLHDIGKLGTYEYILDKPGRLTDEEFRLMRQHPAKGAEILAPLKQLSEIIPGVKHHHEFYDGSGYPDGLKGEDIPLFARILTVADTVDAMAADRPYRDGRTIDVIFAELKRCSGSQFDPKMVEIFLKAVALSPGAVFDSVQKSVAIVSIPSS